MKFKSSTNRSEKEARDEKFLKIFKTERITFNKVEFHWKFKLIHITRAFRVKNIIFSWTKHQSLVWV